MYDQSLILLYQLDGKAFARSRSHSRIRHDGRLIGEGWPMPVIQVSDICRSRDRLETSAACRCTAGHCLHPNFIQCVSITRPHKYFILRSLLLPLSSFPLSFLTNPRISHSIDLPSHLNISTGRRRKILHCNSNIESQIYPKFNCHSTRL